MIEEEHVEKKDGSLPAGIPVGEAKQIRILVPVNFSGAATNSLAYALNLAKACQGSISLLHITDIAELPESDNPVVMNRLLEKMETTANTRLHSFKEMIQESGVPVPLCEAEIGNPASLLIKKINQFSPDLVVLGRDKFSTQAVARLVRDIHYPVLVVPESAKPALPEAAVLSSDQEQVTKKPLDPLFKIIHRTSHDLSVLTIYQKKISKGDPAKRTLPINGYNIRVRFVDHQHAHVIEGIASFVKANKIDLLCTIHRRHRFSWKKFFHKSTSQALLRTLDVPVLLLPA